MSNKLERPIKTGFRLLERQRKRWVEYFVELLNKPTLKDRVDMQPAFDDLPIISTVPTKEKNPESMPKQQHPMTSRQRH